MNLLKEYINTFSLCLVNSLLNTEAKHHINQTLECAHGVLEKMEQKMNSMNKSE